MTETQNQKPYDVVRPPIVVVLGHVDHGKSSLLEAITSQGSMKDTNKILEILEKAGILEKDTHQNKSQLKTLKYSRKSWMI